MKRISALVLFAMITFSAFAYAQDPIISNNVVVQQNTTASQCPSSWTGTGQPTNAYSDTRFGVQSGTTGATVQSCTGCSFDPRAKTCTCRVCYSYFN